MDREAFGGGLSGGSFDLSRLVSKPIVFLRAISLLFSVIVVGCIGAGGYEYEMCIMNQSGACGYGIFVGVIAFCVAVAFLILDALFEQLSNVQHRKIAVMVDIITSGIWSFMWFVAFCYLTNKWTTTSEKWLVDNHVPNFKRNNCRAAIAFSFFSILNWGAILFFALQNYRQGSEGLFASADDVIDQQVPGPMGGEDRSGYNPYTDDPSVGDLASGGYQKNEPGLPAKSYHDQGY